MTYSKRWATHSASEQLSRNEWKVPDTSPSTASPKLPYFSNVNYTIGEQSPSKLKQIAKRFLNGQNSRNDLTANYKRGRSSQNTSESELQLKTDEGSSMPAELAAEPVNPAESNAADRWELE